MAEVEKKDFDDDDSLSSSDSEDDGRPPPVMQIERSADLGTLKSALFTMKDEKKEPKEIEERLGKDVLSSIASSFEKPQERSPKEEKEKIVVDKEQYSSFKQKFENIDQEMAKLDEERKAQLQREIQGAGKETLTQAKTMFERGSDETDSSKENRQIDIERSEADRKRVKETFFEPSDKEEPRDCAVCGKMVYPVEKVQANKRVYHKACFKCHTCQKTLSVQGYTAHEGKLYCKLHIMEIYRPEVGLAHEGALEADTEEPDDEEEEYAVVAKPKMLDPSVVRSGLKTTDDLDLVPKLQSAKTKWAESAEQASKVEKRSGVEADLIQQGKVKSRLSKFVEGGEALEGEPEEDDEDDANRDPNIIRSTKKKEAIHVEVGAKTMKGKWESGTMETAQNELQDRSQELEDIKKGVSVKQRFKERTGEEEEDNQRRSTLADEQLDTTFTKSAKERFQKGEAFQDTAPVEKTAMDDVRFAELGNVKKRFETGDALAEHVTEKTAVDVRCAELGNIKAAFEQSKGGDQAGAEARRQQIQEEFNRIKSEKMEGKDEEGQNEDLGSIKKRFEEGTAFQTVSEKKGGEQVEMKVAGKAREKFRQIDQDAPKEPVINQAAAKEPSKWAKDKGAAPEPVNRRVAEDSGDEEPEEYEVKSLLSKFKNIEQGKAEGEQKLSKATDEELAAIRVEAKNLKTKFEKGGEAAEDISAEEKRKQIEEEFKRIKEMKETQKADESEPEEIPAGEANPDLALAAEHAQKARAKWDKIQRKEAKKAQKAAAVSAKGGRTAKQGNEGS